MSLFFEKGILMKKIVIASLALVLAGCGPSEEELKKIEDAKKAEAAAMIKKKKMAEYRAAAANEISNYSFSPGVEPYYAAYIGFKIDPDTGDITVLVDFQTEKGVVAAFAGEKLVLTLRSVTVDFKDPEIPDIVSNAKQSFTIENENRVAVTDEVGGDFYVSVSEDVILSPDQRKFYKSKLGSINPLFDYISPELGTYTVTAEVIGIDTYREGKPFDFEYENFFPDTRGDPEPLEDPIIIKLI